MTNSKAIFTDQEFAHLGEGKIGYLRRIRSQDLASRFPSLPPMAPNLDLWALFGATGEPIVLSDVRANALASARDHELQTVMLH